MVILVDQDPVQLVRVGQDALLRPDHGAKLHPGGRQAGVLGGNVRRLLKTLLP